MKTKRILRILDTSEYISDFYYDFIEGTRLIEIITTQNAYKALDVEENMTEENLEDLIEWFNRSNDILEVVTTLIKKKGK